MSKMKRRLISYTFAIVLVFSFTSVALAASFSATKCTNYFTTAAEVSRPGTAFSGVEVKLSTLTYTPYTPSNPVQIDACSSTAGGTKAGTPITFYLDGYWDTCGVYGIYEGEDTLKVRVINTFPGTNAKVSGNFRAVGA